MSMYHVYPHNTENGGQCDCHPEIEVQQNGEILVIHNSWDGREIFEELDAEAGHPPENGKRE